MGCGRAAQAAISAVPPPREPVNQRPGWPGGSRASRRCRGRCRPAWRTHLRASQPDAPPRKPRGRRVPTCRVGRVGLDDDRAAGRQGRGRVTPATEKASGKLLAPKTATGPTPMKRRRSSGRGGVRSGKGVSMRGSCQEPSRSSVAKSLSWLQVRPRSPSRRTRGRPVSAIARSISASPMAMICAAMPSRKSARCASGRGPVGVKGLAGEGAGFTHLVGRHGVEGGLQRRVGTGVEGLEGLASAAHRHAADEGTAVDGGGHGHVGVFVARHALDEMNSVMQPQRHRGTEQCSPGIPQPLCLCG